MLCKSWEEDPPNQSPVPISKPTMWWQSRMRSVGRSHSEQGNLMNAEEKFKLGGNTTDSNKAMSEEWRIPRLLESA